MRREDRRISDIKELKELMGSCDICRLGFADGDEAYIVPLNFGFSWEGELPELYFHSASEGRKIELARKLKKASFEMENFYKIAPAEKACDFSNSYKSIMGKGSVSELSGEEKKAALTKIMEHYTARSDWEYSEETLDKIVVLRLKAEELSGKWNF